MLGLGTWRLSGLQRGVTVLPKSASRDRIEANAQIFDFELSEQDMSGLDRLG